MASIVSNKNVKNQGKWFSYIQTRLYLHFEKLKEIRMRRIPLQLQGVNYTASH